MVSPNQHSATKYSTASQVMAVAKATLYCIAKYQAGAAKTDQSDGRQEAVLDFVKADIDIHGVVGGRRSRKVDEIVQR